MQHSKALEGLIDDFSNAMEILVLLAVLTGTRAQAMLKLQEDITQRRFKKPACSRSRALWGHFYTRGATYHGRDMPFRERGLHLTFPVTKTPRIPIRPSAGKVM
jgi:hypothetical protein